MNCWARFCASTLTTPLARTCIPRRRVIPMQAQLQVAMRFSRWECAIRSDFRSIARRDSCMSATSDKARWKRSTSSPWAGTTAGGCMRAPIAPVSIPGFARPANFVPPIAQYGHSGGRCSITGGYVYRGSAAALPAGTYVFGDYCTGEIFSLASGAPNLLLDTALNISSFGEDEAGEIYVVGLGGTVHRIASTATTTTLTSLRQPGAGGQQRDLHRHRHRATIRPAASASPRAAIAVAGCGAVALTGSGNPRTASAAPAASPSAPTASSPTTAATPAMRLEQRPAVAGHQPRRARPPPASSAPTW